ncbi:PRC-barrel domain-containing protein [Phaeobacter sp. HF9A]|uniref:PRC-barrel domain-containing protein n=1 Tax=Phaeobacter sp. HF9A TaxID=2721561 RepID=UPI00142FC433|nr:PRC-barrel domain-containing protein [Phaeobacter sp. HF9A]NIZ12081.1 PRC-barrel domain containing protein [Phaeobacter sp. HF9A]
MKFLTTTAAIAVLTATSAYASSENTMTTEGSAQIESGTNGTAGMNIAAQADTSTTMGANDGLIRTRDITGGAIYSMKDADDESWAMAWGYDDMSDKLREIGEIEDIVLSKNGEFKGIIAEIGGFLDIGDKHVMIPVSDVKLVAVDDKSYAYVTRMSEDQLEHLENVDEGFWN